MEIIEWANGNGCTIKMSRDQATNLLTNLQSGEPKFTLVGTYREFEFEIED